MKTQYPTAKFLTSAAKASQFPEDTGMEVAFAGRSNAGKSSAINTLCQNRQLARTSKTPGRTQLINFFSLDEQRRLVDLPGYGYAKVPIDIRDTWQQLMESYLSDRNALAGLVMIMDIRHPLKNQDQLLLDWCAHYNIPTHLLLSKADKLKNNAIARTLREVEQAVKHMHAIEVQAFSALKKTGVEQLERRLNNWFEYGEPED